METRISEWRRYFRIWRRLALMHMRSAMLSRFEFATYVAAKLIRFGFSFIFSIALFQNETLILGYTRGELLLFFGTMSFIDIGLQVFFRGLMAFPYAVRNGELDTILSKPIRPFFWASLRMFDPMDLATVPAALGFLGYAIYHLPYSLSWMAIGLAALLLLFGCFIALAINILTAALAFWSPQIENAYWIYRDLTYVARFPPEVFPQLIQTIFIFILPILVFVSFPAKALMGRLELPFVLWSVVATCLWLTLSLFVWKKGLKRYTSASS